MLEIKTSFYSNILNIELYGALDSLTAPDFKHWLTEKSASGYHYFSLNCGGLEFISSRGIGILTELNNVLNGSRNRFVLYHVSNEVLNLLQFLKLSDSIPIVDTFDHVRQIFSKNPPLEKRPTYQEDSLANDTVSGIKGISVENGENAENQSSSEKFQEQPKAPESGATISSEKLSGDEEYIDLNSDHRIKHGEDISVVNIVFCPNCGEKLKVSKKGLYLCPECRAKFNYPFQ